MSAPVIDRRFKIGFYGMLGVMALGVVVATLSS